MNHRTKARGPELAAAVQAEIERVGLADQLRASFVPERDVVRITHVATTGTERSVDYPVDLKSVRPILDFLRIEARLASVRRARVDDAATAKRAGT